MHTRELIGQLNAIRAQDGKVHTNIYRSLAALPERDWQCMVSEHTVCIFFYEGSAQRCQFLTTDLADLVHMLREIPQGITLEIIGRQPEAMAEVLQQGGFQQLARMQRWANRDITSVFAEESAINNKYGAINSFSEWSA